MHGMTYICTQNLDMSLESVVTAFAGREFGDDCADTPEKVLHYYRLENPKPELLLKDEAARAQAQAKEAKDAIKAKYMLEYQAWIALCKEIDVRRAVAVAKQRSAEAKLNETKNHALDIAQTKMHESILQAKREYKDKADEIKREYIRATDLVSDELANTILQNIKPQMPPKPQ